MRCTICLTYPLKENVHWRKKRQGVSIVHCVRYAERTKMGHFVIIYIWCKFNTCTFSIDFLPCPRPVNWLVYRLCSNQVLLLAQFCIDKSCLLTPLHFELHHLFTKILYSYKTVGKCSHRLPSILYCSRLQSSIISYFVYMLYYHDLNISGSLHNVLYTLPMVLASLMRTFYVHVHFLYSHDLYISIRGDTIKKN